MADQNKVTVSTVYRDCEFNNIKGSNILNIAFTIVISCFLLQLKSKQNIIASTCFRAAYSITDIVRIIVAVYCS